MEKKPIDTVVAPSRGIAALPPQFSPRPAVLRTPAVQPIGTDVDREILEWIMSHVHDRDRIRPKTSLM